MIVPCSACNGTGIRGSPGYEGACPDCKHVRLIEMTRAAEAALIAAGAPKHPPDGVCAKCCEPRAHGMIDGSAEWVWFQVCGFSPLAHGGGRCPHGCDHHESGVWMAGPVTP